MHSCLEIVVMYFDCAGSRNLGGSGERLSRLRSRCGAYAFLHMVVIFYDKCKGKIRVLILQSRFFGTSIKDQNHIISNLEFRINFRGRCKTLDMHRRRIQIL